ncbi:MAG: transcriptional regulator [Solirubrobacterales bacterium]|nr:transcriptional regulator [Solirubrobacterales bacterium]
MNDQPRRTGPSNPPKRAASDPKPEVSIKAISLTDSAASRIAAKINSGEIMPGQRLPSERALASELNVSRPALREALQALQSAGLVRSRRGSGWYVLEHGSDDGRAALSTWMALQPIGDIVAVRRTLEPDAVRSIPATRVADVAAQADELLKGMRRALRNDEPELAAALHSSFHRTLVQFASTRLHRTLLASMIDSAENTQLELFRTPQADLQSLERHRWIAEALDDGDVEETARRVAAHLEPAFTYTGSERNQAEEEAK